MKKGVSPLIATVLLIGFTFSIGVLLLAWGTGMEKSHTSQVSEKGEKEVKCTFAHFKAPKELLFYNFSSSIPINLTIINTGSEPLYNFSFTVITDKETAPKTYIFEPTEQKTKANPLNVGNSWIVHLVPKGSGPSEGETLSEIIIKALCQDTFVKSYDLIIE